MVVMFSFLVVSPFHTFFVSLRCSSLVWLPEATTLLTLCLPSLVLLLFFCSTTLRRRFLHNFQNDPADDVQESCVDKSNAQCQ